MTTTNPFDPTPNRNPFDDEFVSRDDSASYDDDDTDSLFDTDDEHEQEQDIGGEGTHGERKSLRSIQGGKHAVPPPAQSHEASWQFLGDLPYRRVVVYDSVAWGRTTVNDKEPIRKDKDHKNARHKTYNVKNGDKAAKKYNLSSLPPRALSSIQKSSLNPREYAQYLASVTTTLVTAAPNGGPIATVTIPLATASTSRKSSSSSTPSSALETTWIRIMTNSGQLLSTTEFPPRNGLVPQGDANMRSIPQYGASDILEIGFTSKWVLVVVLRDSLCLTYSLTGNEFLPPFYILKDAALRKSGSGGGALEVISAHIYDGGVAVLSANMTCALAEFLNEADVGDAEYKRQSHVAARIIPASSHNDAKNLDMTNISSNPKTDYALVTPLNGTSTYAKSNYITYTSIAVLSRRHTKSRHPELFLGGSHHSVLICDVSAMAGGVDIVDVNCQERISAPIHKMCFAPNGRFLACFTENCILTVLSTNFETKVLDFDTSDGSTDQPSKMEWCGEDSVVLYWKSLGVLMVGPYGDWLRFPYSSTNVQNLHLVAESDSCRVITDQGVEILQRVPPATAAMLRIGSIEPAAMLLDASDAFHSGSAASDESARAITKSGMLEEAIEVCTEAAQKEFDVEMQKRFLKAASFGMHFSYKDGTNRGIMGGLIDKFVSSTGGEEEGDKVCPTRNAILFVQIAQKIRVLNALRDTSVGFVLTVAQYDSIMANGVIARLISMKRPALATSISSYLKLDENVKAYARASRASAFVMSDVGHTDAETAEAAMKILNSDVKSFIMNRGCYASVALVANKAGRPGVSNLLLTLETSVMDKVPAMATVGLHSDAAAVATKARNVDLIFRTLMDYEKSCLGTLSDPIKAQNIFMTAIISKFPKEARNVLASYYEGMTDVKKYMNLQLRGEDYIPAGTIMAKRAVNVSTKGEKLTLLQESSRIFCLNRDNVFQKTCTDEFIDLLLDQERLKKAYGPDIIPTTSSISETIYYVFSFASIKSREAHKLFAEGEKLAKKYKVTEKRLWHTKVNAFSSSSQWGALRSLADSRLKPPISFKYFALAAIKEHQSTNEISRYIEKASDADERYDLFYEAKLWKKAFQEARKMDDLRRVMQVRSACNMPEIQRACDEFLSAQ